MKDIFQDLVSAIGGLNFEVVKTTVNSEGVLFESVNKEKTVIMKAKTKEVIENVPEGIFGLSNMKMLEGALKLPALKEEGAISIDIENNVMNLGTIAYRLTMEAALPNQPTFSTPDWDVIAEPTKAKYGEMKDFSSVMGSVASKFQPEIKDNMLRFYFGANKATHTGYIDFAEVSGFADKSYTTYFPVNEALNVINLVNKGEVTINIMARAMEIQVDTGLIEYKFIYPSHANPDA